MRPLAYRRHQHSRYRRRAERIVAQWRIDQQETRERLVRRIEKNRRACSCWMCSRSRKLRGPSVQEQRQPQWADIPYPMTSDQALTYYWNI